MPTAINAIDMGTAKWHEHLCVRAHGEECTMCVDHCPVGPAALELINDRVTVHTESCVGCGLCGEVAHAAVLCPSFYRAEIVKNPSRLERIRHAVRRRLLPIGARPEKAARQAAA